MLVNGVWTKDYDPVQAQDKKGGFVRKQSSFRDWLGSEQFAPEPSRYHLYVYSTA